MGILVPTAATFPVITHSHGEYARAVHPINLDSRQQYLISGSVPPTFYCHTQAEERAAEYWFQVVLPPWSGGVAVAIRAIRTAEAGALSLQLRTEDANQDPVALSGYLDLQAELDAGTVPDDEEDWAGVSWAGLSGVQVGQGGLTLALTEVTNATRIVWLWVESTDCALRDLAIRPIPSSLAVEG